MESQQLVQWLKRVEKEDIPIKQGGTRGMRMRLLKEENDRFLENRRADGDMLPLVPKSSYSPYTLVPLLPGVLENPYYPEQRGPQSSSLLDNAGTAPWGGGGIAQHLFFTPSTPSNPSTPRTADGEPGWGASCQHRPRWWEGCFNAVQRRNS